MELIRPALPCTEYVLELDAGKNMLCIDGMEAFVGDYRKIAEEWKGDTILLSQMLPNIAETRELAKWNGDTINLHLCGNEHYDLAEFIDQMRTWNGNKLCIGYSGPKIFTKKVIEAFAGDHAYQEIQFQNCEIPDGFINALTKASNKLTCVILPYRHD